MKSLIIALLTLTSLSSFAAVTANCVQAKGQKDNPWIIGDEEEGAQFELVLDKNKISTNLEIYKGNVTGKFVKVTEKESYMFNTPGLTEYIDQSDFGYTFISKELMNGKNGKLTVSVRQLGDSEGAWWLSQNFYCTVVKK